MHTYKEAVISAFLLLLEELTFVGTLFPCLCLVVILGYGMLQEKLLDELVNKNRMVIVCEIDKEGHKKLHLEIKPDAEPNSISRPSQPRNLSNNSDPDRSGGLSAQGEEDSARTVPLDNSEGKGPRK